MRRQRRQRGPKKLGRTNLRKMMIRTLAEALDPSTMTLQQIIDSGMVSDIDEAIEMLRQAKRLARGQAKELRAQSAAQKTAEAKKIIAYYLVNYIAPADLSAASAGGLDAMKTMFQHVTPKSKKDFDPVSMSVVEKPHKFRLKDCEILVFWTFHELGIELTGGQELRDAKNPANYGADSASFYAKEALKELEEAGLIITNMGVPGVRSTAKRIGRPAGEDIDSSLSKLSSDFNSDNFRLDGPDLKEGLRRMILKEIAGMSSEIGVDIDMDIEYVYLKKDVPGLSSIANTLDYGDIVDNNVSIYLKSDLSENDEIDSELDSFVDDVNEDYLDEEIEFNDDDY